MILRRSAITCVALCLFSGISFGQVVFDNDSGDGLWETATNWSGDALPGAGDNVQVHSGLTSTVSSSQTMTDFVVASDGAGGTAGTVNHTAGTLTGSGTSWSKIGTDGVGNVGVYNMSGTAAFTNFNVFALGIVDGEGTLNIQDQASLSTNSGIAMGGVSTVNQTGGTVTSGAWLGISNFGGGTSNYNISAGSVISNGDPGTAGDLFSVGEDGVGNLNVSGTAIVEANGAGMNVGRNDNSTGTLEIDGSDASVSVTKLFVDTGAGASGTLSWIADANGVTEIVSGDNTEFGDNALLSLDLTGDSDFGTWGVGGALAEEILLIDNTNSVTGTFAGLAEGASVDIGGGLTGVLSYVGGDGNDVTVSVFTAVPEPSSVAITVLGLAGLMLRRRRQS